MKFWAEVLAKQTEDEALASWFVNVHQQLVKHETTILNELEAVQGQSADLGGYYFTDQAKVSNVMRPSATLNQLMKEVG